MNWTGSDRRREQGTCRPPAMELPPKYRVRSGSPCQIRRVGNISNGVGPWLEWATTHVIYFDCPETVSRDVYVFRHGDWEIRVDERYVDKQ